MPRQTNVTVPVRGTWVQLTDANVTTITFKNVGGQTMLLLATNGTTSPVAGDVATAITCEPGRGEVAVALADLFPGIAGRNRLWATSDSVTAGTVAYVSHA
jgi:hypothetical protein